MGICEYYLQGRCKYGANCRYEHPNVNQQFLPYAKQFNDIMIEVITSERGGQWPLSCYAPIRDRPAVPNLEDISPEELRTNYYNAKKTGQLQNYVIDVNNKHKKAQDIRNFLKEPSAELGTLIQQLQDNKVADPKSTFRFNLDDHNKGSIFGNSTFSQNATSIFGAPNSSKPVAATAPSVFSPPAGNIFAPAPPANIFNTVPPKTDAFPTAPPIQSVFGNSAEQSGDHDSTTYSTELSDEEKAIYLATMFTFGEIPQKPPTKSLC